MTSDRLHDVPVSIRCPARSRNRAGARAPADNAARPRYDATRRLSEQHIERLLVRIHAGLDHVLAIIRPLADELLVASDRRKDPRRVQFDRRRGRGSQPIERVLLQKLAGAREFARHRRDRALSPRTTLAPASRCSKCERFVERSRRSPRNYPGKAQAQPNSAHQCDQLTDGDVGTASHVAGHVLNIHRRR